MKLTEQIGKGTHVRPGMRRYLKRTKARAERRKARMHPEDAPTRRCYAGWAD